MLALFVWLYVEIPVTLTSCVIFYVQVISVYNSCNFEYNFHDGMGCVCLDILFWSTHTALANLHAELLFWHQEVHPQRRLGWCASSTCSPSQVNNGFLLSKTMVPVTMKIKCCEKPDTYPCICSFSACHHFISNVLQFAVKWMRNAPLTFCCK